MSKKTTEKDQIDKIRDRIRGGEPEKKRAAGPCAASDNARFFVRSAEYEGESFWRLIMSAVNRFRGR